MRAYSQSSFAIQYLNRALSHHIQHALDLKHLPLTDDAEAQRWCSHDQTLVRAAVLHAIGREEFVKMAKWLSDVKGHHFHAGAMLFTLATDAFVFNRAEKKALLLQSTEFILKAKEAPGWVDTKERMDLEYFVNLQLAVELPMGSPEFDSAMERNVEISSHSFFADDPEKKASSLFPQMTFNLGFTPANPAPPAEQLRKGSQQLAEVCAIYRQVAEKCAEQGEGGAKEAVFRAYGAF